MVAVRRVCSLDDRKRARIESVHVLPGRQACLTKTDKRKTIARETRMPMPSTDTRLHRVAAAAFAVAVLSFGPVASVHAADEGSAERARDKVSMCIGCHGIRGYHTAYPRVYSVPMIAGQEARYIENALAAYKSGERSHPSMRAIAGSLSEQDMADLAAYYAAR